MKKGKICNALLAYTLLDFWIAGSSSVLVDCDHLWKYTGNEEPWNLTGWIGRPFHHPVVYLLLAFLLSFFATALISRWNAISPVSKIFSQEMKKPEMLFLEVEKEKEIEIIEVRHEVRLPQSENVPDL